MTDFLRFILGNIFDSSVVFEISEEELEDGRICYHIKGDEEYKPSLIGRNGRIIKSIHNLVSLRAKQEGKAIIIKVD